MMQWRLLVGFLLAAQLMLGVAVMAILPPFEGIDEDRHFSRLQSQMLQPSPAAIASWKGRPDGMRQRMTMYMYDYYQKGPMPYYWIQGQKTLWNIGTAEQYITYADFFRNPGSVKTYLDFYQNELIPKEYAPGVQTNLQFQHPDFYYGVIGQVLRLMVGEVPLGAGVLILRVLSFFLAFGGFCTGLMATWHYLHKRRMKDGNAIVAIGALYPFLTPQYFWEFGRIGNDSMCLFLFGVAWAFLLWHLRAPRSEAWLGLGLVLGLGWLTKDLFLPVSFGLMAFLTYYHLRFVRYQPGAARDWWPALLKILGLLFIVGAPFYLMTYMASGDFGALNMRRAISDHDALRLLIQNFSISPFMEGIWTMLHTFVWAFGGWSLMIIAIPIYKLLVIFTLLIFGFYIMMARQKTDPVLYIPVWVILPLLFGMICYILTNFITGARDSSPGYYLHILAPCFALMYGMGLKWVFKKKWLNFIAGCVCLPVILLNFIIVLSYMTAFSGCAVPTRSDRLYLLHPKDIWACMGKFPMVIERLEVLAWPHVALAALAASFLLLAASGILALKIARKERQAMS